MAASFYNISTYSRFNLSESLSDIHVFIKEFKERVKRELLQEQETQTCVLKSFADRARTDIEDTEWLQDNQDRFFKDTLNEILVKEYYLSQLGFICSMVYSPDGGHIIVGHSTGLIQMRHGETGIVLATLRNIQFPSRPIFALEYSKFEERICYAACTDGNVYRIEIPNIDTSVMPPALCIHADPALECLGTQYYGSPGTSTNASPYITQRSPALALGMTADNAKMIVGYADTSIKVFDIETMEAELTYKVHKLRLQFIPKKLKRIHFGQVCAVKCHDQKPFIFASGAWDKTLRVWDIRCKVGCMMTFEGVNITHDSIDLNRDQCISGSWQPMEAFSLWDLVARKRLAIIRAQNRRHDVDGEYIYACRYWKSSLYNRKGKYGIIGGSGTNCVEVINLHNRYITCSYPAPGSILAVASHEDRIAFGGTAPVFNIVNFHDPKHDPFEPEVIPDYDYTKPEVTLGPVLSSYSDPELVTSDLSRLSKKSRLSATSTMQQIPID